MGLFDQSNTPSRGIMDVLSDAMSTINGEPTSAERQKLQETRLARQEQANLYQRQKEYLPYHMRHYDPNTIPKQYWLNKDDPENTDKMRTPVFRAGTEPKDTDPKTGLETISMRGSPVGTPRETMSGGYGQVNKQTNPYLPLSNAYSLVRDMKAAEQLGVAQIPPKMLAGIIMQEGSGDMTAHGYDITQPKQVEFYKKLVDHGIPQTNASTLTQLTFKNADAERLKIPFPMAWNGTGKNWAGQSGRDYTRNVERQMKAAEHEKNAEFMKLLNTAYEHGAKYPVNPAR